MKAVAGLDEMRLLRKGTFGRGTLVEFQPLTAGVPVFESHWKVLVDWDGSVIAAIAGRNIGELSSPTPQLTAETAVKRAFRAAGRKEPASLIPASSEAASQAFTNPNGLSAILADLTAFPLTATETRLAWRIFLEIDKTSYYEILIDATDGKALFRHELHRTAGVATVFKIAPDKGDRETVNFPDTWLPPSATVTTGNFVDAYIDRDGNDRPDTTANLPGIQNGRAAGTSLVFNFPAPDASSTQDPRNFAAAAVTNAFYFANVAHDYFYGLGFTESAGNFQTSNGDRGGRGNDAVNVEVQDLFVQDNASMSITLDGSAPRLQLGIYTRGTPSKTDDRDFAYDGQVVMHEYTHGVTNRSVGGGTSTSCLAGVQSRALDEGWADYFASSFFNDPVQSAYTSPNTARGIRRASYEGYKFTYEDLGNQGFESHQDGEIWAATLWDLRKTLGQQVTDRLVFAALRLTPCRPSFIDARDAILAADRALNNGSNRLRIFQVFANHGMGGSAAGFDGSSQTFTVFNAAFDLPPDLASGNRAPAITSRPNTAAIARQAFSYRIEANDPDGGTPRFELSAGPQGLTVDPVTGVVAWTPTFTSERVKVIVTDGQGGRVIHGFFIAVITPLAAGRPATINAPRGSGGIATILVPEATPVLQVTLRGGTGNADLLLIDPDGFLDLDFPRPGQTETISVGGPIPGTWFVLVTGTTAFDGVQLTASLPEPRVISGNASLPGQNGDPSSETFYRIIIPPGASGLEIRAEGGSGDVDLVVRSGRPPVCQVFEEFISFRCFYSQGSFFFGNREALTVPAPPQGDFYINLTSASGYAGVTLTTRMSVRPTLTASRNTLSFTMLEGGSVPAAQNVSIADPSGSAFAWTATINPATATWLRIDKTSGTGDATIAVSVNPAGLAAGSYTATVQVAAPGLNQTPQTITVTFAITRKPTISANVTQINFASSPGQNPAVQTLEFTNTGGGTLEWTAAVATTSGGSWLSVDQPRGISNSVRLQVVARAGSLPAGAYDGTITLSATDAANVVIRVRYVIAIPITVADDSVRSVAAQLPGYPVSPGDMLVLTGANLTADCSMAPDAATPCPRGETYPLPTELGGASITVNDVRAPLLLVTPTEIRFIVPFEARGEEARIVVSRQGASAPPVVRPLVDQTPGVFAVLENGGGAGKIYHADGSLVSRGAPAAAEEEVSILTSGLGRVSPAVATGAAGPSTPAQVILPPKVFIDGDEATVVSAVLEPGTAGMYRVRAKLPAVLGRKYPSVYVQTATGTANEVSAGGMSLLDVSPALVSRGSDATVTLRGVNLPANAAVKAGSETIPVAVTDGLFQTIRVTIPAALIDAGGEIPVQVTDPAAPNEGPSNTVVLRVRP